MATPVLSRVMRHEYVQKKVRCAGAGAIVIKCSVGSMDEEILQESTVPEINKKRKETTSEVLLFKILLVFISSV